MAYVSVLHIYKTPAALYIVSPSIRLLKTCYTSTILVLSCARKKSFSFV